MENILAYYRRQADESAKNLKYLNASNQPLVNTGGATQLVNVHDSIVKAQELLKRRKRPLDGSGKKPAIKRRKPNASTSRKGPIAGKKSKSGSTTGRKKTQKTANSNSTKKRKKPVGKKVATKKRGKSTTTQTKRKSKSVTKKRSTTKGRATRDIFGQ